MLHTNFRSIIRKFDVLQLMLNGFNFILDRIVLTETWKVDNVNLFRMSGYDTIYSEEDFNKCDGTLVYLKSSLMHTFKIHRLK